MARPLKWKSVDAATEEEAGRIEQPKGHDEFGLFVEAYDGFDPEADDLAVRVEGTVDEDQTDGIVEHFAPINRGAPEVEDVLSVEAVDLVESDEEEGVYVAYVGSNSFPIGNLRANVHTHSGGFSVDAWVLATGSGQAAYRFSQPDGP